MNKKMVFNTVGRIVLLEAFLFLLPMAVSVYYWDLAELKAFGISCLVALLVGGVTVLLTKTKDRVIYAKEGFVIVALAWIALSLIGCLPFYISRQIPNFIDAFFETVSGFTTTGSSVVPDVTKLTNGILFWRSFTHWVGGMGVLVFIVALIPNLSDRPIHMLRAEMPGPTASKLMPKLKDTAKILYLIYIALTLAEIFSLKIAGLSWFSAVVHSFGTAGTGGFGIKPDSIGGYSPTVQWIITVFMLVFGINFNMYYLVLIRRARAIFKSAEFWTYVGIVAVCTAIISINVAPLFNTVGDTVRNSAFQVASLITTTGYATTDFNLWPGLARGIMFILLFTGGCAGSTAGGLKLSRVVLLFKTVKREFKKLVNPRSVSVVRFEGKPVEEETLSSISVYFAVYIMCFVAIFLILCLEPFSFETNLTAAATTFNNVGPGFDAVGPAANFAAYSGFSKIILSISMLLGRLEIYPLLIAFIPSTWTKK